MIKHSLNMSTHFTHHLLAVMVFVLSSDTATNDNSLVVIATDVCQLNSVRLLSRERVIDPPNHQFALIILIIYVAIAVS
jgi:hypothetical protein